MEKMNDLKDLLKHEIDDLYSAEEQIIDALPAMIEKASNNSLKNSLSEHLQLTQEHKNRLDQVRHLLKDNKEEEAPKKKKFLGIFGGGSHKCKGMEGIISEGKKIMGEDMDKDVMDAAIIAAAQKVEHYEICGYGTARSYAHELGLEHVAKLLSQTLNEEYASDDKLTFIAETRINKEAEGTGGNKEPAPVRTNTNRPASTAKAVKKEMELEPVLSPRTTVENKSDASEKTRQPKASATPRSTPARSSGSSSKKTTGSSKASAKSARGSNSSGRGASSGRSNGR